MLCECVSENISKKYDFAMAWFSLNLKTEG